MRLEDELSGGEVLYDKTRDVYVQICARMISGNSTTSISGVTLPLDGRRQEIFDYPMDKYSLFGTGKQELYEALPLAAQMKAKVRAGQEIYFVGVIYPLSFQGLDLPSAKSHNSDN